MSTPRPSALREHDRSEAEAVWSTLLIVNRKARHGDHALEAIVEPLAAGGRVRTLDLDAGLDLEAELGRIGAEPRGRLVIAGGDGTVNSCVEACLDFDCPIGIIPLGTANDFARTLGLPADPVAAAAVIATGRTMRVDVARANDRYFVNSAGLGFSSRLARELNRGTKRMFGDLAYALAVARAWRRHKPFWVEIDGDLRLRRKVIQLTIANGKYYGGGMTAHESATIDDGLLTVLVVEAEPLWRHLLHVVNLKTGVYDFDAPFSVGHARSIDVATHKHKQVTLDGERGVRTPVRFEVIPQALNVFVAEGVGAEHTS